MRKKHILSTKKLLVIPYALYELTLQTKTNLTDEQT